MKTTFYILIFLAYQILLPFKVAGQGEYNHWCLSDSCNISFNNTTPIDLGNSALNSGSPAGSTISDKNGTLLFYLNVTPPTGSPIPQERGQIFNAQHQIMQNGDSLYAEIALQSVNILPFPCNDSLYYIFSISINYNVNPTLVSLYYSVVNINVNNGLGAVIQKNILLDSNLEFGFAMTRHANNMDYWISYRKINTNIHIQRHISSLGIGVPINSIIGSSFRPKIITSLKFSPNGQKLVNCLGDSGRIELYDFDNSTGVLSNLITLTFPSSMLPTTNDGNPKFSQISPDNSKLYISSYYYLVQYDLSNYTQSSINNSLTAIVQNQYAPQLLAPIYPNIFTDITLGPNQKIYIISANNIFFNGITNPNSSGLACTYIDSMLATMRGPSTGFPTMLPNLFVHRDVLSDSLLCQYDTVNLYLSDTNFIDSVAWDFGDTASGALNTSTDVIPLHVFNTYGTYPIEVIVYSGCVNDTIHDTIRINPTPIAQLGNDTILCEGDSLDILFTDTSFSYLWNTSDTTLGIEIWQADTYWVELSSVCGVDRDSIVIDSIIPAFVHFPNDTLMCEGDSLFLDATVQNGTYLWSTGDTVPSLHISAPGGTFWVQTINICNADSDTIVIDFTHAPLVDLGNDSILCNGANLVLNGWDTLSTFSWNTGDSVSSILVDSTGIFNVVTTNLCGIDSDTIQLWFIDPPTVSLGNDTILCPNATIVLRDTSSAFPTYLWNNGAWFDSTLVAYPGVYALTVTNACGVASDTVEVWYDNSPVTNLGPDARYCISQLINLDAYWSRATYLWNTTDTTHDITANYTGQYWVQVTNLCGFDDDTVNIAYDLPISFNLGSDTVLCAGDSFLLAAPAYNASWTWQDGSTDSTFMANQSGTFWVSANNFCGTFSDTVHITGETLPVIPKPINDTAICSNEAFVVSVPQNNATSILWIDGSTDYQRTFTNADNYFYTLYNICGQAMDSFKVIVEHPLEFGLGNDTVICYGEEFTKVLDYPNHSFLWNNGSTENFQTITRTGVYGVTIWTAAHCESYDELEVTACQTQLFIPNAFTPGNGDDLNNTFKIKGIGIRAYQIVIYDRWGQQVFESTDLENSWDGFVNGEPAASGVYSYKVWYNLEDGKNRVSKLGVVTLVR